MQPSLPLLSKRNTAGGCFLYEPRCIYVNGRIARSPIKELEDKGVDIVASKTCVDYYELGEKLTAGKISGMAQLIELAAKYEVITLS